MVLAGGRTYVGLLTAWMKKGQHEQHVNTIMPAALVPL